MGQSERIQTLRELLSTPSHAHWQALWQAVDEWPKHKTLSVEWDYLAQHIKAWPAHLLLLPEDQHEAWQQQGTNHPLFPFVKGLLLPEARPDEQLQKLSESPHAAQIAHLEVQSWSPNYNHTLFPFDPKMPPLASLVFRSGEQKGSGLISMLQAPALQALTRLSLQDNGLRQEDCHTLVTMAPPTLQHLNLDSNFLHAKDIYQLFASPRLANLTEFSASWNQIGNKRLCPQEPAIGELRALSLAHNRLGAHALCRLLQRDAMGHLTTLDASGNRLGPGGLCALAAQLPASLESLNLRSTDLGDKGALAFADALQTPHLQQLDLSFNGLSPHTLRALQAHPTLAHTTIICEPIDAITNLPLASPEAPFVIRTATHFGQSVLFNNPNGDALATAPPRQTYMLADGTGGYNYSAIASELLVRATTNTLTPAQEEAEASIEPVTHFDHFSADLCQRLESTTQPFHEHESQLYNQVLRTNHFLLTTRRSPESIDTRKLSMVTTFAAVAFTQNRAMVTNVGRARVYRWRQGDYTQLSKDHTYLDTPHLKKELGPEEIESYLAPHLAGRSVGEKYPLALDTRCFDVSPGDVYLLCSTSLHHSLGDARIHSIVERHLLQHKPSFWRRGDPLQRTCDRLVKAAKKAGGAHATAMLLRAEAQANDLPLPEKEDVAHSSREQ